MEQTMAQTRAPGRLALALGLVPALMSVLYEPALATPIEYQFGGVITYAGTSTGVAAGTPFSGTFSFDPAKPSGALGFEGFGQASYGYSANSPGSVPDGSGLSLQIGGQTILANPGGLTIATSEIDYAGQWGYRDASGKPVSPYTTVVISNSNVDGGPLQAALKLMNPTRGLADSLYPLNLAEFPDAQLNVTLSTNSGVETLYTGTIDSLVETPVPEPTYLTLLCFVAISWFARTRRDLKLPSGARENPFYRFLPAPA
jgi:hypothetical protein